MKKKKILIVEDEVVTAMQIRNYLILDGYEIVGITSSGDEAIYLTEQYKPDLAIIDIVLKGKTNGITAAIEIKSKYNIPIIYCTSYTDEKTMKMIKKSKMNGCIKKPVSKTKLSMMVGLCL